MTTWRILLFFSLVIVIIPLEASLNMVDLEPISATLGMRQVRVLDRMLLQHRTPCTHWVYYHSQSIYPYCESMNRKFPQVETQGSRIKTGSMRWPTSCCPTARLIELCPCHRICLKWHTLNVTFNRSPCQSNKSVLPTLVEFTRPYVLRSSSRWACLLFWLDQLFTSYFNWLQTRLTITYIYIHTHVRISLET